MKSKKILAGKILNTSPQKIKFLSEALPDINKAITRSDIRGLIAVGKIVEKQENYHSRARARKTRMQKRKGRQKGKGSKKGSSHSVVGRKAQWMSRVRAQRHFLKELRDKQLLASKEYRILYRKSKGGFFRNVRHIKLYITEHNLIPHHDKTKA